MTHGWSKSGHAPKRNVLVTKKDYLSKDLRTSDALYKAANGIFYFIKFKAKDSSSVVEGDIWEKAFESLYAASLVPLKDYSMAHIREHAEFLLVVKSFSDKTKGYYASSPEYGKISASIRKLAKYLDADGNPIYFRLAQFRKKRLYRDVHTFSEEQFIDWARKHLV